MQFWYRVNKNSTSLTKYNNIYKICSPIMHNSWMIQLGAESSKPLIGYWIRNQSSVVQKLDQFFTFFSSEILHEYHRAVFHRNLDEFRLFYRAA